MMREDLIGANKATKATYKQTTSLFGVKRNVYRTLKCETCNKPFEHNCDEHLYKYEGKVFCSYTCKRRYLRIEGIIE